MDSSHRSQKYGASASSSPSVRSAGAGDRRPPPSGRMTSLDPLKNVSTGAPDAPPYQPRSGSQTGQGA